MPVFKARRVEDLPCQVVLEPHAPENLRLACELSCVCARLARQRLLAGVHKHGSIDERHASLVQLT